MSRQRPRAVLVLRFLGAVSRTDLEKGAVNRGRLRNVERTQGDWVRPKRALKINVSVGARARNGNLSLIF
jgi:hypothetical protein